MGYGSGEFEIFAIDCGGSGFEKMFTNLGGYDYIFNLSALKHVRSEKDPYTLLRMIEVNILNTLKTVNFAKNSKPRSISQFLQIKLLTLQILWVQVKK